MHRWLSLLLAIALTSSPGAFGDDAPAKKTVYDYSLVSMEGKVVPLANYKGKVLLIVNLASQSQFASQIAALNELEKTYADKGLVVLGIPSADFGAQELKDPAAVRKFYAEAAHAEFTVFASATLTGVHAIPLYQFLCNPKVSLPGGDIHWSFTKFLINRDGQPVGRYEVASDPADLDFHVTIESALAGKLKAPKPEAKSAEEGAARDDDDD
jgi:glutathione peroxidase